MTAMPSNPAGPGTTALAALSQDDFTQALIAAGFLNAASGGNEFHRIKPVGNTLVYNDEVIAVYNPKTKEPALIVQLVDQAAQYQSMWFDKDGKLATFVNRPQLTGKFCRSHYDHPEEARKFSEDGTNCEQCPVGPFIARDSLPAEADGRKCQWKADVDFRILEKQADGTLQAVDETVYTMSLSMTSVIEFFGSNSKQNNPQQGSVSDENFMVKLAKLGFTKWGPSGLLQAMGALRRGGVIAEIRLLAAQNKELNRNWTVVSFNPIEILEITEQAALPEGSPAADDALPF